MKKIKLGDYIELLTDYHSGGSYETLRKNTKILHKPDYGVYIRTLNFERNDFKNDLVYCDKKSYDFLEYSHLKENDILMNKIANPGSVYLMPKVDYPATCAMNLFLLRFKGISQRYMYYVMKNSESYIKKQAHGTTTKTITKEEVRDLEFSIHETEEERVKVEKILSNIDKKIENNNTINNNLLQMIDTIYQEFVFSNRARKTDFQTQNMFKNDLYTLIKPGVSQFDTKTYYATSEVNDMNIGNGWIISYDNRESRANMTPTLYSVWFAKMKNSVKHLFLNNEMSNFIDNSILSTGFYGLQCNELTFEYIASIIHNANFEKLKDILSHGATQQGIGDDDLKNIKLLVPSQKLLREYHNKTAPIFSLISKNINENNELIRLRDYLLPLLMNGQATIEE